MGYSKRIYEITGRKGINDLKSLFAFIGNSQGDDSVSNNIQEYLDARGWMSFIFKCDLNKKAIESEIQNRKLWNENYIKDLKEKGEYGKIYIVNCEVELDHLYDAPIKETPLTESFKMVILNVSGSKDYNNN